MPSPFPGIDPYLEGSEWTSVPAELSSEIARQLSPKLRPKYDLLNYDLSVDYTRPPEVPLEGEAAIWANEILKTSGEVSVQ